LTSQAAADVDKFHVSTAKVHRKEQLTITHCLVALWF